MSRLRKNWQIGDGGGGDLNSHSIQGSIVREQYHKATYLGQKYDIIGAFTQVQRQETMSQQCLKKVGDICMRKWR